MAEDSRIPLVAPFCGERYDAISDISDLIAPPYDVIDPDQRTAFEKKNAHNIVSLILPKGNGDKYDNAANMLAEWRKNEVLKKDKGDMVYVVQQEFVTPAGNTFIRTGVIAAVAVEPYEGGRVRPHEKTHKGPKEDRLALMRSTKAMFEALLMMSPDKTGSLIEEIGAVTQMRQPEFEAVLDEVVISLWPVGGKAARAIAEAASHDDLYIADGHHRYETGVAYSKENPNANRTLGLIVPLKDPGLVVLPTHRMIGGSKVDTKMIEDLTSSHFDIEHTTHDDLAGALKPKREEEVSAVVVLPDNQALRLSLKTDADLSKLAFANDPTLLALDVAKVDSMVVTPLAEAAGGEKLSYTPDIAQAKALVDDGAVRAAVLVNPVSVQQVLDVADAGSFMPQKSTYFQPKAASGLVTLGWE